MKVILIESSQIEGDVQCKITSLSSPKIISRRLRRETSMTIGANEVIIINQRKTGSNSYATLEIDCQFQCGNLCSDSMITYAIDVVLAQLEFTGLSLFNLFYSGSSASTTGGSAVLLPSINLPFDMNSLDSLQPKTLQTLYYEQILDRSIPVTGYRATVDYEFEVPSIVFDHTALIYVLNQTNKTIVFGFGNADAYAQTLGWPQTGIAMLFKGECLSTNANDIFMLSGFIYDSSKLTVSANFTPSQIGNISNNTNITFGRNNTTTINTTAGNPQPYAPNASYVSSSFFSNATAQIDNVYYTHLNGSNDSQADDESGCYFNSLSQALIYDIVDPSNYNDQEAYNELTENIASQSQRTAERSIETIATKNAREAHQINFVDSMNLNDRQESLLHHFNTVTNTLRSQNNLHSNFTSHRRRRRRRRLRRRRLQIVRSTNVRSSVFRKRSLFGGIGKFVSGIAGNPVDAVKNAFNTVADVASKASSTIAEVSKIVKTATVGGEYEKSGQIDVNIGYDEPQEIYSGNGVYANCEQCKVDGTVDLHGKFNFKKEGVATVLSEGFVEATGRLNAKAIARIGVNALVEKTVPLATIPLTPITVPGIFALGPSVGLDVGVHLQVTGDLQVTFGASVTWNEISTKIDFKDPQNSQSSGWKPSNIEREFSYETKLEADLGLFVKPKIELGLTILNGVIKVGAGLAATCTAGVNAVTSTDSTECVGGIQAQPYFEVDLSVYAEANLGSNSLASETHSIFTDRSPIGSDKCIGGGGPTTPDLAG